jgi:hypothetical protein
MGQKAKRPKSKQASKLRLTLTREDRRKQWQVTKIAKPGVNRPVAERRDMECMGLTDPRQDDMCRLSHNPSTFSCWLEWWE